MYVLGYRVRSFSDASAHSRGLSGGRAARRCLLRSRQHLAVQNVSICATRTSTLFYLEACCDEGNWSFLDGFAVSAIKDGGLGDAAQEMAQRHQITWWWCWRRLRNRPSTTDSRDMASHLSFKQLVDSCLFIILQPVISGSSSLRRDGWLPSLRSLGAASERRHGQLDSASCHDNHLSNILKLWLSNQPHKLHSMQTHRK